MTVADVSFAVDQASIRTVALWCSAQGPVLYDGGVIVPLNPLATVQLYCPAAFVVPHVAPLKLTPLNAAPFDVTSLAAVLRHLRRPPARSA